jgi:hypothetical protein
VLRPTVTPPAAAGPLRVTVQAAEPPGLNEAGLQVRELIVRGLLICAPVALREIEDPWGSDPMAPIAIAPAPETVAEPVATTPSAMTFWFGPSAMHAYPPVVATHVNDFPAAVNAGPAVMERLVTLWG